MTVVTPSSPLSAQRVALLTGVGVGDLIGLIWIQPDLLLAAAQDAGGQPLLEPEHAAAHGDSILNTMKLIYKSFIRVHVTQLARLEML